MRAQPTRHGLNSTVLKLATLILCCFGSAELLTIKHVKNLDTELLHNVVTAVERATVFFEEDYASINVDGLFGIRLCQGSVIECLTDCSRSEFQCPVGLTRRLEQIKTKLSEMAEKAMPYIEQQDPKYFQGFLHTIDTPYTVHYIPERLGDYIEPPGSYTTYDEDKGDECYASLMGTYSDNDRIFPKCTVTDWCWDYMTRPDTASYVITHQLLYFIIGEKTGCLDELEKHVHRNNATSVRELEKHLCGRIYAEAKSEDSGGSVDVLKQDLFLEQSVLCGILGFQDFFSRKWITMVLSWQTAVGCFTLPHKLMDIQKKLNEIADMQRDLLDLLYEEARQIDESRDVWLGRTLMRDKAMNGDCLAHKTGLAFGTLGTYVRHLLRQLYSH